MYTEISALHMVHQLAEPVPLAIIWYSATEYVSDS